MSPSPPPPRTPAQSPTRVLLAHYQEIALKGQNRVWFIRHLARNLRDALAGLDVSEVRLPMGRIDVPLGDAVDLEVVRSRVRHVFGIANYSIAHRVTPEVDAIRAAVLRDLPRDRPVPSFRVEVRRAHKQFPVSSPALERDVGGHIQTVTGWPVDLSAPAFTVWIEIVPKAAYYHFGKEPGAGGLPTGTGGRVLVLLSGGIDSPVAAWRMMRRGCLATFVHFHAHPFLSHASIDKARELVRVLAPYQLGAHLMLVPFGELQREVTVSVPGPLRVVVYRRLMLRIAAALASKVHARALVTGDAVGQVASQTLDNLATIDGATDRLVVRPLVGMAKEEIIADARRIGTFPISVLPDEDCCTLFTPRHPVTRAKASEIARAEADLPLERMVAAAVEAPHVERVEWPAFAANAASARQAVVQSPAGRETKATR